MTTQGTFVVRASTVEESSLERITGWAIVAATCLVMVLGPFLTA